MARKNSYDDYKFEDVSSFTSDSDYKRTRKAKKGRHRGLKVFITVVCVLLIIFGGGLLYVSNYLLGGLTTNAITKDKDELGIVSGVTTDPKITNIALFGVDSRGDVFEGRSDVIMVLTVDEIHKKVKLSSLLRDCRVYMGDDYDWTDTGYDKITHAYAYGGPEFAIRAINQNFKLNIEDYVTVNFSKMAQIVDAFNGIDIEITGEEMEQININLKDLMVNDPDTGITENDLINESGSVHLNGNQAVAYSRIRNIDNDNMRAARQQIVLNAVMTRVKTMGVGEYPEMIRKVSTLCETSMDFGKIMGFVPFVVGGFSMDNIIIPGEYENSNTGEYENGGWMWDFDLDVAANHLEEFIYEEKANTEVNTVE